MLYSTIVVVTVMRRNIVSIMSSWNMAIAVGGGHLGLLWGLGCQPSGHCVVT